LRLEKKAKFQGLSMGKDGNLKPIELYGPGTFAVWKECWAPFRTGCIMMDTMDPATLDMYADHLEQYVYRYGAAAWPIIYQADVHARTENIERVRRAVEAEADMAQAMGARTDFEADRPWNKAYRQLVLDQRFWKIELEDPAFMLLGKIKEVPGLLTGDALTQQVHTSTATTAQGRELTATIGAPSLAPDKPDKRGNGQRGNGQPPPKKARGGNREHQANSDGTMVTNRAGKELCREFQSGRCQAARSGMVVCPRNQNRVHQCAKCLSPSHGSSSCSNNAAPTPRSTSNRSSGKGKGKGDRR
jgi:hypothetical protein